MDQLDGDYPSPTAEEARVPVFVTEEISARTDKAMIVLVYCIPQQVGPWFGADENKQCISSEPLSVTGGA